MAEIKHCEYETEENIKNKSKKYAAELVVNYNDVSKIDKVGRASNEVKELEGEIGTGIKKLMDNQESLNSMSDKA